MSPLPGARRGKTFDALGAAEVAISFQWHQNGLSGRCRVLNFVLLVPFDFETAVNNAGTLKPPLLRIHST